MQRRQFTLSLTALAGSLALAACNSTQNDGTDTAAPSADQLKAGRDYLALQTPAPNNAPAGQVEVVEFFGYWCPHCNAFEPSFTAWMKNAPAHIVVHRVPVAFDPRQVPLQRLYYTLQEMGKLDVMHERVFAALHQHKQALFSNEAILAWAAQQPELAAGDTFAQTYHSFGLATHINKANQLADAYAIDGVPCLGVGGKYMVTATLAQSMERMLSIATALADQLKA